MSEEHGRAVIGVDLGGTKVLAAVVSGDGQTILGRAKRSTPAKDGAPAILDTVTEAIREASAAAQIPLENLAGIGIGSPGPLDVKAGIILYSANMNVRDFPLARELSERIGRPVLLQNDVRVGGYGEFRLGAGRGYKNILAAFVGTGIGGCLICDGKVVEGATGNAGEVGHIVLKAGGPRCGCGHRGCMEALASRTAIAKRVAKAAKKGLPTILSPKLDKKSGKLKSGDLAHAVEIGDAIAIKEVQRSAHYLGLGLGSLVNVFGPEIVIIGGGVAAALGNFYVDLVRKSIRKTLLVDPGKIIQIEPASLGDDAGILGAALFALERFAPAD